MSQADEAGSIADRASLSAVLEDPECTFLLDVYGAERVPQLAKAWNERDVEKSRIQKQFDAAAQSCQQSTSRSMETPCATCRRAKQIGRPTITPWTHLWRNAVLRPGIQTKLRPHPVPLHCSRPESHPRRLCAHPPKHDPVTSPLPTSAPSDPNQRAGSRQSQLRPDPRTRSSSLPFADYLAASITWALPTTRPAPPREMRPCPTGDDTVIVWRLG